MDINEQLMVYNDNEDFGLTQDQNLLGNPKYIFKLKWVSDPKKIKLKRPNLENTNDTIFSNNEHKN